MAPTKGIPSRRKSIAVTSNQNEPIVKRRRAHSIAPGERLSPLSKARRSLAPRKSILKASVNLNMDGDEEDVADSGDFRTEIRDNTTQRAIFARRVSFAEHAHVRLFNKENNTNSTASPQSSPAHQPASNVGVNDENAYPGASAHPRRRSSIRRSLAFSDGGGGEESMEMDLDDTAQGPSAFMFARGEDAEDDLEEEEEYDGDDMEMTEALSLDIIRKRSLSSDVQGRLPLSSLPAKPRDSVNPQEVLNPSSEPDQSYVDDDTISTSASTDADRSQPLEYTVPLIKPPAPPSDAWLALRSVTHSGDTPYESPTSDDDDFYGEQGMELTDAVQRLLVQRHSLGMGGSTSVDQAEGDSFASTNDSFGDDGVDNQTVDVMSLIRRASMSAATEADSTMDITGDYGAGIVNEAGRLSIAPVRKPSPQSSIVATPLALKPSVFSAPVAISPPEQTVRRPQSHEFTPRPFDFIFVPQSQLQAPSSPSKFQQSKIPTSILTATNLRSSPQKRPAPSDQELETDVRSSPAKKLAVAGVQPHHSPPTSPSKTEALGRTSKRLSPSKKPPFLAPPHREARKSVGSVRRPSGYFAQRKSMGASMALPQFPQTNSEVEKSPRMMGRMSVGHGNPLRPLNVAAEKAKIQRETEAVDQQASGAGEREPVEFSSTAFNGEDNLDMQIVNPAAQWRESVQEQSFSEDETPIVSIEQFFSMTGIKFMDEIIAPRRSTIHSSALRPRRQSSPSSAAEPDIPLAEYVTAMAVDVPQLELYTRVGKDLEGWVERSKVIFQDAEAEAEKITPELFREFLSAGEDGQAELLHHLKLLKANTVGHARSEWYDWKLQWVERLCGMANESFHDLTEDAKALEGITRQARVLVPSLREEYEQILQELEQEKLLVVEIEECDQEYLNELKNTLAEQNAELEAYKADVAEGNAKLERLEEKLRELELQKFEATVAIEKAETHIHIQNNSTLSEVFRLKDELESLEDIHSWRTIKIQPDFVELIYASSYQLSIPCIKFQPLVEKLEIRRLDQSMAQFKDVFPQLTQMMMRMAKDVLQQEAGPIKIHKVVQRLSDYWSSCAQLRSQLKLVAVKYPVSIDILPEQGGFRASASILFPSAEAKAVVSFIFDLPTFSSWPMSIASVKCAVDVAYGTIDHDKLLQSVVNRVGQASPSENHACLMDACIEAADEYS